jgi:hypothetical protein|tara:strand:+ start:258 stop:446 length:189 start_codon:yes stop_codon:yes gene_type:complete
MAYKKRKKKLYEVIGYEVFEQTFLVSATDHYEAIDKIDEIESPHINKSIEKYTEKAREIKLV